MFLLIFHFILLLQSIRVALSATNPVLSAWKQSTGSTQTFSSVAYKTDILGIYYSTTYAYVQGNGIPSYSIGPWLNPNTPSGQSWTFKFPLTPSVASSKFDLTTYPGQLGAWINGIAMYGPGDGFSFGNLDIWHRNAFVYEVTSFDQCLGHADKNGIYHNHVIATCLILNNSLVHSPIVGYAFDGYPVYGPYGYSNATNSASGIRRMISGFATRSISTRTTLANGTILSVANAGPPVNSTYPLGNFIEDFAWSSTNGDLDACNGRFAVTPEYPSGTYAYFLTVDSSFTPVYPFILGQCYYGNQVLPNGKMVNLPSSGLTTYFAYSSSKINELDILLLTFSLILAHIISVKNYTEL